MKECAFCQVVIGQDAQNKWIIRESDMFVAMLVSHPVTEGHFIVLPKRHISELKAIRPITQAQLFTTATEWAEDITSRLGAKAYVLKLNNNLFKLEKNPLHVGHIHLHVIPRYRVVEKLVTETESAAADTVYFDRMIRRIT